MNKPKPKTNTQNVRAVVEQTIARAISGLPALSGIFNGANVSVFCSTDEDFGKKLSSDIKGALGQTVRISYAGRDSLQFVGGGRVMETGRVNITVSSALLLANGKPETSISIADAIDDALTGSTFNAPFSPLPVIVSSSTYGLDEATTRYVATLVLKVQFVTKQGERN